MSDLAADQPGLTPVRLWVAGARPRTLPISVIPVLVGTAAASVHGAVNWWRAALAVIVSLALQVGVNYGNDYSDGVRGTDADRVGPMRLVASGAASPRAVRAAAFGSFAVAAVAGLVVAVSAAWWLVAVGAACIAGAWYYTGGKRPYGYRGFGDVAVFVFFGLVAVVGSAFVARDPAGVGWLAVVCAVPCGLLAVAILVANNLRDIPRDAVADKRTLAVLLGDRRSRWMYVGCLLLTAVVTVVLAVEHPWAAIALLASPLAVPPIRAVRRGATGRELIAVLLATGRLQVGYGLLLTLGLAL